MEAFFYPDSEIPTAQKVPLSTAASITLKWKWNVWKGLDSFQS